MGDGVNIAARLEGIADSRSRSCCFFAGRRAARLAPLWSEASKTPE
jgi:class 3 adenylate cyclase